MKSPNKRELLDGYAKYAVFKRAYDVVNKFIAEDNFLAAFVLSFSILEDRLTATFCICRDSSEIFGATKNVSKITFKKKVDALFSLGVIDKKLRERLMSAAADRNILTHQMMWNIDVFAEEHINKIKRLINDVVKCKRSFERI